MIRLLSVGVLLISVACAPFGDAFQSLEDAQRSANTVIVQFIEPADTATEVQLNDQIRVGFNLPIDPLSFDSCLTVSQGESLIPGFVGADATGRELSFYPESSLRNDQTYRITLTMACLTPEGFQMDAAVSSRFQTIENPSPPTFVFEPAIGTAGVSPLAEPRVIFSERMNPESVADALTLWHGFQDDPIPGRLLTSDQQTFRFVPDDVLPEKTTLDLQITTQAQTESGYFISEELLTFFSTGPYGDVRALSPIEGRRVLEQPTLVWTHVAEAEGYTVEIADDPSFATPMVTQTTPAGVNEFTLQDPLPAGEFHWRVAHNLHPDSWAQGSMRVLDNAVYVDGNADPGVTPLGTRAQPLRSISDGITLASQLGASEVRVAHGHHYEELIVVINGISITGGYDATTWQHLGENTLVNFSHASQAGETPSLIIHNIDQPTTISWLELKSGYVSVDMFRATEAVVLENMVIKPYNSDTRRRKRAITMVESSPIIRDSHIHTAKTRYDASFCIEAIDSNPTIVGNYIFSDRHSGSGGTAVGIRGINLTGTATDPTRIEGNFFSSTSQGHFYLQWDADSVADPAVNLLNNAGLARSGAATGVIEAPNALALEVRMINNTFESQLEVRGNSIELHLINNIIGPHIFEAKCLDSPMPTVLISNAFVNCTIEDEDNKDITMPLWETNADRHSNMMVSATEDWFVQPNGNGNIEGGEPDPRHLASPWEFLRLTTLAPSALSNGTNLYDHPDYGNLVADIVQHGRTPCTGPTPCLSSTPAWRIGAYAQLAP